MAWHIFVEAGSEPMLIEINKFVVFRRRDMNHEEANKIIIQQLYHKERHRTSFVVANDIVIFIILVHFIHSADRTKSSHDDFSNSQLHCWFPCHVRKHQDDIISSWLAPGRLTGCNKAKTYFRIGKIITLKILCAWLDTLHTSKQTWSIIHQASTALQFSLLWPGELEVLGKHWQVPQGRSHCLQMMSLSMKTYRIYVSELLYDEIHL